MKHQIKNPNTLLNGIDNILYTLSVDGFNSKEERIRFLVDTQRVDPEILDSIEITNNGIILESSKVGMNDLLKITLDENKDEVIVESSNYCFDPYSTSTKRDDIEFNTFVIKTEDIDDYKFMIQELRY